jgi:chitin synthase
LMQKQNFYFAVILYSTFALAAVRFVGVSSWAKIWIVACLDTKPQCLFYFLKRNLFRCCRRN